jgi:hypothetical protein
MSSFIGAIAIADLVKTTLGPKGMDKILQSVSHTYYLHIAIHAQGREASGDLPERLLGASMVWSSSAGWGAGDWQVHHRCHSSVLST